MGFINVKELVSFACCVFVQRVMLFFCVLIVLVSASSSVFAVGQSVVVYPIFYNNADKIITDIRDGIKDRLGRKTTELAIDSTIDRSVHIKKLKTLANDDLVIALTSEISSLVLSAGYKGRLIEAISDNFADESAVVRIGIQPSPSAYLKTLKKLKPGIRRFVYFYYEGENEAELAEFRLAASKNNVQLHLVSVNSLSDAMTKIDDELGRTHPSKDAIWLSHRILSMANNTVLKFVLHLAWQESLLVFSDSLDAVVRGLLFTLIPDYQAYGRFVGRTAKEYISSGKFPKPHVIPYFDDVNLMFNQRFAVHIGVNIRRSQFEKYNIVVPAK